MVVVAAAVVVGEVGEVDLGLVVAAPSSPPSVVGVGVGAGVGLIVGEGEG